jgi:hypothetical protein
MATTATADVHVYDLSDEDISVTHWTTDGQNRYTVRLAGVVYYMEASEFENHFVPRVKKAIKNPKTV